jgi:uncharacterized integral membrane protein
MGSVVAITAGLVLWIVLWSIGVKAFDAFLVTMLIALLAGTARIITPYLPGNRDG